MMDKFGKRNRKQIRKQVKNRMAYLGMGFLTLCLFLCACEVQEKETGLEIESELELETSTESEMELEVDKETDSEIELETEMSEEQNISKEEISINLDVQGPIFSAQGGCYPEEFSLSLASEEGDIYYTLDGSDPMVSSTRIHYEQEILIADRRQDANIVSAVDPVLFDTAHGQYDRTSGQFVSTVSAPSNEAVDKCTVVKAVTLMEDGTYSRISASTYFIGPIEEHIAGIQESCEAAGMPLAVISITMNYDDLFDSEHGIYVSGDIFQQSLEEYIASGQPIGNEFARKLDANYSQRGRAWEREAYLDFYESDGTTMNCVLSQSCGIRIQGNFSRSDLIKGFRIYARGSYGESHFDYPIFGEDAQNDQGEILDSYKTFVLRNGGNCAFLGKFNDAYWQSLIRDLHCETQHSRPAVVYLNGEYWGLYILQEDYSEDYFEENHGVDSKQVILYKGDAETYASGYKLDLGELPEGIMDSGYYFSELYEFFRTHDNLVSDEDYAAFAELVDIESCRDYFAVQCWINNKWDWPGKNWSMWRTLKPEELGPDEEIDEQNIYNDGRWRFCFYDVEFGGVSGISDAYTNTIKEDNYKPQGLLDIDTNNPAVLCFAYLMTNEGFRQDFYVRIRTLNGSNFLWERANARLMEFEAIYGPLYDQFFTRYPGAGNKNDALYGGYGSAECIRQFLKERRNHIQELIDYCESVRG